MRATCVMREVDRESEKFQARGPDTRQRRQRTGNKRQREGERERERKRERERESRCQGETRVNTWPVIHRARDLSS